MVSFLCMSFCVCHYPTKNSTASAASGVKDRMSSYFYSPLLVTACFSLASLKQWLPFTLLLALTSVTAWISLEFWLPAPSPCRVVSGFSSYCCCCRCCCWAFGRKYYSNWRERERESLFCAEPIKQLCVQASSVAVGRSHNNDHENANEILREHTVDGAAEKKETTTTTRDWEKIRIRQRKKGRMEEEKGAWTMKSSTDGLFLFKKIKIKC